MFLQVWGELFIKYNPKTVEVVSVIVDGAATSQEWNEFISYPSPSKAKIGTK